MAEGYQNVTIDISGTVTPNSNVNGFNNNIQRHGNVVTLYWEFNPKSTLTSGVVVGYVPEGFRPFNDIISVVVSVSSGFGQIVANTIRINTNGEIVYYFQSYQGLVNYCSVAYPCS